MQTPFDIFWATYPRKVAKGAARRAWDKALKKTTPEKIMFAVGKQTAAGVFACEMCFVPHPATWLNQERWDDEVVAQHSGAATPRAKNFKAAEGGGVYGF